MNSRRYQEIEIEGKQLLPSEFRRGWHYCENWDDMLVGPTMTEWESCHCDLPYKRKALAGGEGSNRCWN